MSARHKDHAIDASGESNYGVKRRKKSEMSLLRYFADSQSKQVAPEINSLTQHKIRFQDSDGGILENTCMSPGSFFGNRIGIQDISSQAGEGGADSHLGIYLASGRNVYKVHDGCRRGGRLGSSLKKGKGGMYLPDRIDEMEMELRPVPMLQMRAEVQSIQITQADASGDSGIILTDTYGRAVCGSLSSEDDCVKSVYTVQPDDGAFVCEGGWTGGVLSQHSRNIAAIARHFPKDVTVFDGTLPVRTLNTLYCPNDLTFLGSDLSPSSADQGDGTPLLAVAEGNVVTIWDLRIAGRGARIHRISTGPYSGHLYTIAAISNGCSLLGASGQDRDVCIWDPRTWKTVDRWRNSLKYEVTSLHFMKSNPRYCVVSGMDYEVVCGSWLNNSSKAFQTIVEKQASGRAVGPVTEAGSIADATRRDRVTASFRGTSRWLGFAKAPGERDVFAGITSDGMIYVSEFK